MKKAIIIALVVLLTLFIAACNTQKEPTGPTFDPFVGGTEGVRMEFVEGMPPLQDGAILDNGKSTFSIGLKLSNVGEQDINTDNDDEINYLVLQLKGILPEQFGLTYPDLTKDVRDLTIPLQAAKKNVDGSILPGQFATISFDGLSYLPDAQGDIPKTFLVDVCYDYRTKSTTPICVASDVTRSITSDADKAICLVNAAKVTKNSGGPVQITDFKQLPQGGSKISIIFTVSHVGTGQIYKFKGDETNPCDDSLSNVERNKVWLELSLPDQSSEKISCMGDFSSNGKKVEGEITLFEGNPRTVTCTIDEQSPEDIIYEDLLEVDMYYRYGQTAQTTVTVKDLGSANEG